MSKKTQTPFGLTRFPKYRRCRLDGKKPFRYYIPHDLFEDCQVIAARLNCSVNYLASVALRNADPNEKP